MSKHIILRTDEPQPPMRNLPFDRHKAIPEFLPYPKESKTHPFMPGDENASLFFV